MEYAIQLLLPILGGLWLGGWLNRTYGVPLIWSLVLAIIGMGLGLGILYKRSMFQRIQSDTSDETLKPRPIYKAPPRKPVAPSVKTTTPKVNSESLQSPGKGVEELSFLYKDNDKIHPDFLPKSEKPDDLEFDDLDHQPPSLH